MNTQQFTEGVQALYKDFWGSLKNGRDLESLYKDVINAYARLVNNSLMPVFKAQFLAKEYNYQLAKMFLDFQEHLAFMVDVATDGIRMQFNWQGIPYSQENIDELFHNVIDPGAPIPGTEKFNQQILDDLNKMRYNDETGEFEEAE